MVELERVESANLLALLLRGVLERNLQDAAVARRVRGLSADVLIRADRMRVTLRLRDGGAAILASGAAPPGARVEGSLGALLDVALGRGLWRALLTRRIRIGGRPLLLLRLLPLLRVRDGA